MNFVKLLRTLFLQNTSGRMLLKPERVIFIAIIITNMKVMVIEIKIY